MGDYLTIGDYFNIYKGTAQDDSITPDGLSPGVTANAPDGLPSVAADTIYGYAGNDDLNGGGGADTIYGGDGNDRVGIDLNPDNGFGGIIYNETATFHGGNGDDTLFANYVAPNTYFADLTNAKAVFYGDAGDDTLHATRQFDGEYDGHYGAATDVLLGGTGNDTCILEEGKDVAIEEPGQGYDTMVGYNDDYVLAPNFEKLVLAYTDTPVEHTGLGNALDNVIIGTDWSDTLYGGFGNDTIYATDEFVSHGGDSINGNAGNDVIYGQGTPGDTEHFNDFLYGDAGNDEIFGLFGNDTIDGGDGDDKLWGQSENDTIYGGDGNDRIGGGSGEDHLYGDAGNDVISGTGGRDWLTGGTGDDRFDWDHVTEFNAGCRQPRCHRRLLRCRGERRRCHRPVNHRRQQRRRRQPGVHLRRHRRRPCPRGRFGHQRQPDPGRHRRRRRAGAGISGHGRGGQPLDRRRLHLVVHTGLDCRPPLSARARNDDDRLDPEFAAEVFQAAFLVAGGVEVRRLEPGLVGPSQRRPFVVDHREPGGVPVRAFDDHVLAEQPLEGEAEAERRALRRFVVVVALPFEATVAELVKDVPDYASSSAMVTIPSACKSAIQVRHACSLRASATRASDLERDCGRSDPPARISTH